MATTALTAATGRRAAAGRLTRDRVLRAALEYVDAHGLAALSFRKLGAELGVPGMTLYTHVDSKDALLDGLVEAMCQELEMPTGGELGWREALRSFARSIRDMIHRHPSASPLLASRHILPARSLDVLDAYLQVVQWAGFSHDRALEVLRVVHLYAQGHALTELSWGLPGQDPSVPADDIALLRCVTGLVSRDTPDRLLRTAVDYCCGCDMEHQFQVGLDLIIHGLEPEAGHNKAATPRT